MNNASQKEIFKKKIKRNISYHSIDITKILKKNYLKWNIIIKDIAMLGIKIRHKLQYFGHTHTHTHTFTHKPTHIPPHTCLEKNYI